MKKTDSPVLTELTSAWGQLVTQVFKAMQCVSRCRCCGEGTAGVVMAGMCHLSARAG